MTWFQVSIVNEPHKLHTLPAPTTERVFVWLPYLRITEKLLLRRRSLKTSQQSLDITLHERTQVYSSEWYGLSQISRWCDSFNITGFWAANLLQARENQSCTLSPGTYYYWHTCDIEESAVQSLAFLPVKSWSLGGYCGSCLVLRSA